MSVIKSPVIPNQVVVHLGKPDESARNITIPFQEYIKNVISSEIYPTWPDEAIKANILAVVSFTLNRIYNEWYKTRGYNFDITSLPSYDQTFILNKEYSEKVSRLVDTYFNNYIVKGNQIQPLFAQYCDGRVLTCSGLSQWGTVSLANSGKDYTDILKYYYGNDISIINDTIIEDIPETYPGYEIKLGDAGDAILIIQKALNRIANNYPSIPVITNQSGVFDLTTESAVRIFQGIFNLEPTGIVNKATWYKIRYVYNSVKKIADIKGEGLSREDATLDFGDRLKYGDTGLGVRVLHYYLGVISFLDPDIPHLDVNSIYNDNTKNMVTSFQTKYNLEPTGEVNVDTWYKLKDVYDETIKSIPDSYGTYIDELYPGYFLSKGMISNDVRRLQNFLLTICKKFKNIPGVKVNGIFDTLTEESVKKIQFDNNQPTNGAVGPITWYDIVEESKK